MGTYVPSIIYITMACLFREFIFLSPALLSITFIILALGKSLRFFKRQHCFGEIFDAGFLIGIAALFYKPAFLLILLLFIALTIMRPFNWREWVIGLSGFITIFFLTGTFYFMVDKLPSFIAEYIFSPVITPVVHFESATSFSILTGFTGILAAVAGMTFILNFFEERCSSQEIRCACRVDVHPAFLIQPFYRQGYATSFCPIKRTFVNRYFIFVYQHQADKNI